MTPSWILSQMIFLMILWLGSGISTSEGARSPSSVYARAVKNQKIPVKSTESSKRFLWIFMHKIVLNFPSCLKVSRLCYVRQYTPLLEYLTIRLNDCTSWRNNCEGLQIIWIFLRAFLLNVTRSVTAISYLSKVAIHTHYISYLILSSLYHLLISSSPLLHCIAVYLSPHHHLHLYLYYYFSSLMYSMWSCILNTCCSKG